LRLEIIQKVGLIVGESLAGVIYAGIVVAFGGKEDPLAIMPEGFAGVAPWVGVVLFVAIYGLVVALKARKVAWPTAKEIPAVYRDEVQNNETAA